MKRCVEALMIAALGAGAGANAQTATWNLANEYPATTLPSQADTHFAERVAALAGGKLAVVPHFDAKLGLKIREHLDAVAKGRVQMANTFAGGMAAAEPIFELPAMPFLTATAADAQRLLAIARPHYDRALARHNQRLVYISPWPPAGLWAKEPVATLDALRRQRVRTFDATSTDILKRLGATAFSISFSEAMPRIQSGDVNAVLSSGDGGAGQRLWQYLPHFTALNYAVPLSFATVNADAFAALDEPTRRAVITAGEETSKLQWERMAGRVEANYDVMRKNNVTITTAPEPAFAAELRAAARSIVGEWEKKVGADAAAILREFGAR
jgi:TRAP-type transport system periplasmic protein